MHQALVEVLHVLAVVVVHRGKTHALVRVGVRLPFHRNRGVVAWTATGGVQAGVTVALGVD